MSNYVNNVTAGTETISTIWPFSWIHHRCWLSPFIGQSMTVANQMFQCAVLSRTIRSGPISGQQCTHSVHGFHGTLFIDSLNRHQRDVLIVGQVDSRPMTS